MFSSVVRQGNRVACFGTVRRAGANNLALQVGEGLDGAVGGHHRAKVRLGSDVVDEHKILTKPARGQNRAGAGTDELRPNRGQRLQDGTRTVDRIDRDLQAFGGKIALADDHEHVERVDGRGAGLCEGHRRHLLRRSGPCQRMCHRAQS